MVDRWALLRAAGVAVVLRRIWMRAFGDRESTVSRHQVAAGQEVISVDLTAGEQDEARQRRDRWSSEPFEVDTDDAGNDARPGDVWIELEIEPLFPSSDADPLHLLDLTEENDPEPTP